MDDQSKTNNINDINPPNNDKGVSLVEYCLLLLLILLVCIGGVNFIGSSTSTHFSRVGGSFPNN